MRITVDRLVVRGLVEAPPPEVLRAAVVREVALALRAAPPTAAAAAASLADAVRAAVSGGER